MKKKEIENRLRQVEDCVIWLLSEVGQMKLTPKQKVEFDKRMKKKIKKIKQLEVENGKLC